MLVQSPLALHMAHHIVLMSLVGPALAYVLAPRISSLPSHSLSLATLVQVALLWFWHAPPVMALTHNGPGALIAQLSLLAASVWFWTAVFATGGSARWRPIMALLVTSKLFCLLGVLLIFAPRPLYGTEHAMTAAALADQQLAGLLMIVACPLTYLFAGVICAAKWFTSLDDQAAPAPGR
jgi:putative membrane protein